MSDVVCIANEMQDVIRILKILKFKLINQLPKYYLYPYYVLYSDVQYEVHFKLKLVKYNKI